MNSVRIKSKQTPEELNRAIWAFLTPIALKRDWAYLRVYGKGVDPKGTFGTIAHSASTSLLAGRDVELSFTWSATEGGMPILALYTDEV